MSGDLGLGDSVGGMGYLSCAPNSLPTREPPLGLWLTSSPKSRLVDDVILVTLGTGVPPKHTVLLTISTHAL